MKNLFKMSPRNKKEKMIATITYKISGVIMILLSIIFSRMTHDNNLAIIISLILSLAGVELLIIGHREYKKAIQE